MQPAPGAPRPRTVARILWLALAGSVVLYGVVAMVLRGRVEAPPVPGEVQVVLHAVAGLLALLGIWLFRRLDPSRNPPALPREGAAAPGPSRGLPPMVSRALVAWAVFEAVGVTGLVSSLLGGNGQILVLASVLLILLHPPREEWFAGT